jgi:hypothetical protein
MIDFAIAPIFGELNLAGTMPAQLADQASLLSEAKDNKL